MTTENRLSEPPDESPAEMKERKSVKLPQMPNSKRSKLSESDSELQLPQDESLWWARGFYVCITGLLSSRGFEIMLFCQSCWSASVTHKMYFGGGAWRTGLWYNRHKAVTHSSSFSNEKEMHFSSLQEVFLKPGVSFPSSSAGSFCWPFLHDPKWSLGVSETQPLCTSVL